MMKSLELIIINVKLKVKLSLKKNIIFFCKIFFMIFFFYIFNTVVYVYFKNIKLIFIFIIKYTEDEYEIHQRGCRKYD